MLIFVVGAVAEFAAPLNIPRRDKYKIWRLSLRPLFWLDIKSRNNKRCGKNAKTFQNNKTKKLLNDF